MLWRLFVVVPSDYCENRSCFKNMLSNMRVIYLRDLASRGLFDCLFVLFVCLFVCLFV